MQEAEFVLDGDQPTPKRTIPNDAGREQLPYWEPFVITEKTTKEMKVTIERWNLMVQRLLDTGEMKAK